MCAGLIGGLGVTPSGNIGANGVAIFESVSLVTHKGRSVIILSQLENLNFSMPYNVADIYLTKIFLELFFTLKILKLYPERLVKVNIPCMFFAYPFFGRYFIFPLFRMINTLYEIELDGLNLKVLGDLVFPF